MLFEINSNNSNFDDIAFEYFNLPKNYKNDYDEMMRPNNIVDPSTGLVLGNMYKDEYKQYKNYMQKRITVNSEREKMLLKIQELDFALNDLNLKKIISSKQINLKEYTLRGEDYINGYYYYKLDEEYLEKIKKYYI